MTKYLIEDPYDPMMNTSGLVEDWREIGGYLIGSVLEKTGPIPFELLQAILFKLTRKQPDLQRVFPFYWGVDGPVSEPLMLLFDLMIDEGYIKGPRLNRYLSRFSGDECGC